MKNLTFLTSIATIAVSLVLAPTSVRHHVGHGGWHGTHPGPFYPSFGYHPGRFHPGSGFHPGPFNPDTGFDPGPFHPGFDPGPFL
jgi:hypothetical protein